MLWALAKPMSFSYFLAAIRALGIPYNIALSLLWVLSAIVAVLGLKKLYSQLFPAEKITTLKKFYGWLFIFFYYFVLLVLMKQQARVFIERPFFLQLFSC